MALEELSYGIEETFTADTTVDAIVFNNDEHS